MNPARHLRDIGLLDTVGGMGEAVGQVEDPLRVGRGGAQAAYGRDQVEKVIYEKKRLEVQFNPESLKVAFSNQQAGGDGNARA